MARERHIQKNAANKKRSDEIKSDFISIISHELRTPLAVSSLHTEMLLAGHAGNLTSEQKKYAEEILFYNRKMTSLLNVFSALSRIELGTFVMKQKEVDAPGIMDEVLKEFAVLIKQKKLSLDKRYKKGLMILTDPEFLRVLFQNIIENAIRYNVPEGSITVTIEEDKNKLLIAVIDTGIGITASDKAHVFKKLYRGQNAKTEHPGGAGLGLYIAKSIVEKCHGSVTFQSKENKGSTFLLALPVSKK